MTAVGEVKWPPEDGEYKCSFDGPTQEKALCELHEDPKQRMGAVETLRKWIKEQPHLNCRTDTWYLLAYLRGAKFSQLRARKMIEGTVSMATENPQWFKNLDTLDPKLIEVFNTGYMLPIPKKDKNGCHVLFQRPGMVDPESKIYGMDEQLRAGIIAGSYLYQSEETQVHGLVFIFDFTGYGIKHAAQGSLEVMKKWAKAIQGNMPGRFRAFHFYNVGPVFESMFNLLKPFVSKKFSDRVFMHGSNFEGVYKHVPMECLPEDYLPDDYTGPHAGSVKEIIENFKQGLAAPKFRAMVKYDSDPKWTCDMRKKPRDEPQNSFRKLNID